jgi:hypothetical protein
MADRLLFVSWGGTVRGREERALEVFNAALAFYGRCQGEGRLESFDVVLLAPSGAGIRGYMRLNGSAEQLAALREDREFMRITADAELIVDDFAMVDGVANQGISDQITIYQESIAEVAQIS